MPQTRTRKAPPLCGLAVACLLAHAGVAPAESYSLRNDTRGSLVIQVITVTRGVMRRDQTVLRVGESTPSVKLDSDRVVSITDAASGKLLFRDVLKVNPAPQDYSITLDPRVVGRIRLNRLPKPAAAGP